MRTAQADEAAGAASVSLPFVSAAALAASAMAWRFSFVSSTIRCQSGGTATKEPREPWRGWLGG